VRLPVLTVHAANLIIILRSYYYQNAATYCGKRQSSFYGIKKSTEDNYDPQQTFSHRFKGLVVASARYVGGPPQLMDPVLDATQAGNEDEVRMIFNYTLRAAEKKVDHKALIIDLLKKALDSLNPQFKRRKSQIRYLMAKQFMIQGKYELASLNLTPGIEILMKEMWAKPLVAMLRKKMACALYLGRTREYLLAALRLSTVAAAGNAATALGIDRHERDELHRDIISVFTCTSPPSENYLESLRLDTSDAGVGYVGVTWRPQFGVAAVEGSPAEYSLPDGYVMEFCEGGVDLFRVKVTFSPSNVFVGQALRIIVTVTSLFQGCLSFADMSLHFTDELIVQNIVHDGSSAGDSTGGVVMTPGSAKLQSSGPSGVAIPASLIFPPNSPVTFSLEVIIPESSVGGHADTYLCLEKIRLLLRTPKAVPGGPNVPARATSSLSALDESTVSSDPVHTGDNRAKDDDDDENPTSPGVSHMNAADSQFVPGADEAIMDINQFGASSVDVSLLIEVPSAKAAVSHDSTATHRPLDEIRDEGQSSILSEKDIPIVTTRERMSSISQVDLQMMDNIDIAIDSVAVQGSVTDARSSVASPGPEVEALAVSLLTKPDESIEEGLPKQHDGEGDSDEEDRLRLAALASEEAAIQTDSLDSANPVSTFSKDENVSISHTEDAAVAVVPEKGDSDHVLSYDSRLPLSVDLTDVGNAVPSVVVDSPYRDLRHHASAPDVVPVSVSPRAASGDEKAIEPSPRKDSVDSFSPFQSAVGGSSPLVLSSAGVKTHIVKASEPEREVVSGSALADASPDINYKELFFDVITVSRLFRETRATSVTVPLKDIAEFVGPYAPRILHVSRPLSHLKLLSSVAPVTSLQGMMNRVNMVFSTEEDEIRNGKIYLSSDQTPHNANSSLFWYPDIASLHHAYAAVREELRESSTSRLDILTHVRFLEGVSFHPLKLNSSFQPAEPYIMPYCNKFTVFSVPLYLKSDVQGTFTVRVKFEYIPMSALAGSVSKEFEIKVTVQRPFALNFGVTSSIEAACGAVLGASSSASISPSSPPQWKSVLRGDVISLTASLNCLNSLNTNIEIISLGVVQPVTSRSISSKSTAVPVDSVFSLVDPAGHSNRRPSHHKDHQKYVNLLYRAGSRSSSSLARDIRTQSVILSTGEKFVSGIEVKCLDAAEEEDSTSMLALLPPEFTGIKPDAVAPSGAVLPPLSIGNVSVKWRTDDKSHFTPVDLRPYLAADERYISWIHRQDIDTAELSDSSSCFDWLLPVGVDGLASEANSAAVQRHYKSSYVDYDISRSLICSMTFSIPAIQVNEIIKF
jgi:hypothetical protein